MTKIAARTAPLALLTLLALGLLGLGVARADAAAAKSMAFDPAGDDWQGLSQLVRLARDLLGPQRVVVTQVLSLSQLERDDAIIMVHPTRAIDVDEIETFMRAGGRVVLVDDYGTGDELLARFHVLRVPMPDRPAQMLRGNPSFAIAEPVGDHSLIRSVTRVVTNHATGLAQPDLQKLLVVRSDPDHAEHPGHGDADVVLALAGIVGKGRLVAIGDASVFINTMMRFPGNMALAEGVVRYAAGVNEPSERHGRVYLLAGAFQMTGTVGDGTALGNAAGDGRRLVFGALETLQREGMPPPVALVMAVLVGAGIVGWTTLRAGRPYRPTPLRFVRKVPLSVQGGVAGRAAALAKPRAPRAEVVLELKRALEDALAQRVPLEPGSPAARLVDSARDLGLLGPDELGELTRLLADLRRLESVLVAADPAKAIRQAIRVPSSELHAVSTRVQAMLRALAQDRTSPAYRVIDSGQGLT
jgi:hypothetical protein